MTTYLDILGDFVIGFDSKYSSNSLIIYLFINQILIVKVLQIFKIIMIYQINQMIESTKDQKQVISKISYQLKSQKVLKSPYFKGLEILPGVKNTHVAFFPNSHGYSHELIHFDVNGNKLGKQTLQSGRFQLSMLSQTEVVLYQQIIKYNGDYLDYISIYNLKDYSMNQCQYFGSDSQDYKIQINLIVFKEIRIICLAETTYQSQLGKPPIALSYKLTYYKPQQIYRKDVPAKKKNCTHLFSFQIKQNGKKKIGFRQRKLNQKGMLALYYQPIQNNLIQFYVYNYCNRQILQFQFDFFQENQLYGYSIGQIWQIKDKIFYVNLKINEKQAQKKEQNQKQPFQKDFIVFYQQRRYVKLEIECKVPYDIQFINYFRQIKSIQNKSKGKQDKKVYTKPVQLVLLELYYPIHIVEGKLLRDFTKNTFVNNKIYQYQVDVPNFTIEQTSLEAHISTQLYQLLISFFFQSLIVQPDQALVYQITQLVKEP